MLVWTYSGNDKILISPNVNWDHFVQKSRNAAIPGRAIFKKNQKQLFYWCYLWLTLMDLRWFEWLRTTPWIKIALIILLLWVGYHSPALAWLNVQTNLFLQENTWDCLTTCVVAILVLSRSVCSSKYVCFIFIYIYIKVPLWEKQFVGMDRPSAL